MKHKIATIVMFAALIAVFLISTSLLLFFLVSLGLLLIYLTILIAGVSIIKWNYFFRSKNKVEPGKVALTFDDGPHPKSKKVLDVLDNYNVKATFFLIGKNCEQHPDLVKQLKDKGHSIGNHSYSHTNNLGWASTSKIIQEIEKTNEVIEKITGTPPKLFRPPFGITNPNIARAVKKTNMKSVGWSIRTYDTMVKSLESLKNKVLPKINNDGHIVLMHDNCEHTAEFLEDLILHCQSKGIEIVNLED